MDELENDLRNLKLMYMRDHVNWSGSQSMEWMCKFERALMAISNERRRRAALVHTIYKKTSLSILRVREAVERVGYDEEKVIKYLRERHGPTCLRLS